MIYLFCCIIILESVIYMKKNIIIISIIVVLFIVLAIVGYCFKKEKEAFITDNEHLYEVALNYLIENDDNPDRNRDRYKLFIDYDGFGITQDKEHRYAYMWVSSESYYVSNDRIISSEGYSMPYKFTFKLNKDEVVDYETAKDGGEYTSSIKDMYPEDIEDRVLNYELKKDFEEEIHKYYSDLNDQKIYHTDEMITIKPAKQKSNTFKVYIEKYNRKIYISSSIEEVYFYSYGKKVELKNYIDGTPAEIEERINYLTSLMDETGALYDGGTKIYRSEDFDMTLVKCNNLVGNKDIYIGDFNMSFDKNMCK